ncbi:MAG: peptidoglycan DD-metalloendopeptidase family protein [Eggerthellaceae bacterium]|nr:peptidoglycan DD-metalloendopeptidase family protein [Eggerthellaceae bacterium]
MITIFAAKNIRARINAFSTLAIAFGLAFACAFAFCGSALATPSDDASVEDEARNLLERIDDCQTAINDANKAIKQAEKEYKASLKEAKKAQTQMEEQQARMDELQEVLEQLSVSMYKDTRSENPLLELLDAESFDELEDRLNSMDTVASEQAKLIEQAREARDELNKAKHTYDAHAEQAREKKEEAEKARKEAEKLHEELMAEAAMITNDIADNEARTSLANAIAEKAFPKGSSLANPCPTAFVSSAFGYRDFDKSFHQGLDLAAEEGTPYYAAASGTVIYATNDGKDNGGAGNWIVIAHGNGIVTKYMHSQHTLVQAGDIVVQGQLIGSVGQTGAAEGAHLHFQVEVDGTAVDPEKAMDGEIENRTEDAAADEYPEE